MLLDPGVFYGGGVVSRFRSLILGSPLPTYAIEEKRLNKIRALAAFSPDALSSIAYANQEIYLGLLVAGSAGLSLTLPIGIAITGVLAIVAISYFQTIHAYPSGGGSYIVARGNLGTIPGLVAAAALMVDYVLTAAVSLTAGLEALSSAFPILWDYRVPAALILLLILTLVNLRGLHETGTLMAIPVYLFLILYIPMLLIGFYRFAAGGYQPLHAQAPPANNALTLLIVLRAFSSGCTALTGIEAISNGVPAFRKPESKNAGQTLIVMAVLMGILFLGSTSLTQVFGITAGPNETILSALARRILGEGPGYYLIQISTLLILAVAANTSFAGFPRVAMILASDGFLPRQLANLGDRLVFSNGILALSVASGLLIVIFGGSSHVLVPLFAVGAFLAFTISQAGMVVHWWRNRTSHWQTKMIANGLGAFVTGLTLIVVAVSKFVHGAWLTIGVITMIVFTFLTIRRHYRQVSSQLSLQGLPPSLRPAAAPRVVIPISGVHRGMMNAVTFAESISDQITAVYVELTPGSGKPVEETWQRWFPDIPLVVLPSPYRSIVAPILTYLDQTDQQHNDGQQAVVVLPEFIPALWWQGLLHNQTSWLLKTALLYRRRVHGFQQVIIDVPYHLKK